MARAALVLVAVAAAAVSGWPSAAEETETTSPPPVLGSSSARYGSGSAGSLAEVARRLRLERAGGQEVVEVNDLNLGEIAAEGTISVTEGAAGSTGPAAAPRPEAGGTAVEEWEKRFAEQADVVTKAEELVAAIDQHRSEARDPYRPGVGPHSTAPGTVTPGQQQRDEAARALAEERAKLDALRREGRRLGAGS